MNEVKVGYKGEKIEYNELHNKWTVVIGDNRSGQEGVSLTEAKEFVDKHLKKERTFKEVEAWYCKSKWGGSADFVKVRITSKTEDGDYWISEGGSRSKVIPALLFADVGLNDELITGMCGIETRIEELKKEKKDKHKKLVLFAG